MGFPALCLLKLSLGHAKPSVIVEWERLGEEGEGDGMADGGVS